MAHIQPPPETVEHNNNRIDETSFLYMGFPKRAFDSAPTFVLADQHHIIESSTSYICPKCQIRVSDIPSRCCVCNLQLNSSSHLARSHHHLFPVPPFHEAPIQAYTKILNAVDRCAGCYKVFNEEVNGIGSKRAEKDETRMQCPKCHNMFCVGCDVFIHTSLHNCPGCNQNAFKK